MHQTQQTLNVATRGQGLYEFTDLARQMVTSTKIELGVLHIFCKHTSASLVIQENADPDVRRDMLAFFKRLVPDGDALFTHTAEGPDDMPAHVKAALTQSTLTIPIGQGTLMLGTWQGLYLFEHRALPQARQLVLHAVGA